MKSVVVIGLGVESVFYCFESAFRMVLKTQLGILYVHRWGDCWKRLPCECQNVLPCL